MCDHPGGEQLLGQLDLVFSPRCAGLRKHNETRRRHGSGVRQGHLEVEVLVQRVERAFREHPFHPGLRGLQDLHGRGFVAGHERIRDLLGGAPRLVLLQPGRVELRCCHLNERRLLPADGLGLFEPERRLGSARRRGDAVPRGAQRCQGQQDERQDDRHAGNHTGPGAGRLAGPHAGMRAGGTVRRPAQIRAPTRLLCFRHGLHSPEVAAATAGPCLLRPRSLSSATKQ